MRVREFITRLEQNDDLAVVDFEVTRDQIPLMIKAEEAGSNRAILFRKIQSHSVPIVANLYGSYARYAMSIGTDEKNLWSKIQRAVASPVKATSTTDAPCFEVVHNDPDITAILPLIKYHSLDAGPYLTSGLLFMKDPLTGRRNISFMRHMIKGPRKIGFNPKSVHNKAYYEKIALAGKQMEVAICVGAPTGANIWRNVSTRSSASFSAGSAANLLSGHTTVQFRHTTSRNTGTIPASAT